MYENSGQKASAISGFDNGATGCAFVNADANKDPATYTARINGATSWHFNNPVAGGTNAGRSVWDASKEDNEASTNVSYSSDVNLSSVKNDGTDGDPKDYSNFYNDNVSGLSKQADQPTWLITDCKTGEGKTCTASTGADGKAQTIYDVDPVEGRKAWIGARTRWKRPSRLTVMISIPPFVRSRSARSPTATAPATGIRTALLKAIRIRRALSQLPIRLTTLMCSTSWLGGLRTSREWCCRRLAAKGI